MMTKLLDFISNYYNQQEKSEAPSSLSIVRKKFLNEEINRYNLGSAIISKSVFINISFIGVDFYGSFWRQNTFVNCTFTDAIYTKLDCAECQFINCKFINSQLTRMYINDSLFYECDFGNSGVQWSIFEFVTFIHPKLNHVKNITNMFISNCHFQKNDQLVLIQTTDELQELIKMESND